MIVYRVAKQKWAKDLSGKGAEKAGGRWNVKGNAVLYTSSTSSLSILELLVHLDYDLLPNDLVIVQLEIPEDSIHTITEKQLPKDWRVNPSPDTLKGLGSKWIAEKQHLVLQVPSAVNPLEFNLIVNVAHPLHERVTVLRSDLIELDTRLNSALR